MVNVANEPTPLPPVLAYARLSRQIHELIAQGKGDSEEHEALADLGDAPWYAMTAQEQDRMRGLGGDLYALQEGGQKRVDMSAEELAKWQEAAQIAQTRFETGDLDSALAFLRMPVPSSHPRYLVPFLQARCWDRLGDLETALVFMKEAERHNPRCAIFVLWLLERLGTLTEATGYAERIIGDANSKPVDLYIAALGLFPSASQLASGESKAVLEGIVNTLIRARKDYLALPPNQQELPSLDADLAHSIGLCYEQMGDAQAAMRAYSEGLNRHPKDSDLLMARGLALYGTDQSAALPDLAKAVTLGVQAIWPYAILARHHLQKGNFREALRLAVLASEQPGPKQTRAEVYETLAISHAELGQRQEWVLESFDEALALDPNNQRIRQNRNVAANLNPQTLRVKGRRFPASSTPRIEIDKLQRARACALQNRFEQLGEQRGAFITELLANG